MRRILDLDRLLAVGPSPRPAVLAASCAALFLFALALRVVAAHDRAYEVDYAHRYVYTQTWHYQGAADRIREEGLGAFFDEPYNERGGARMLVHPPGYPVFVAAVRSAFGDDAGAQRGAQLVVDALSVVALFLVGARVLGPAAGALAAVFAAASPQLAESALVLQPDTVAVLPVLLALLALVEAWRRERVALCAAAGALVGVSCWLRSNAALMPVAFAVALVPLLFRRGLRLRAGAALVLSAVAVVAPVTIRNAVVFGRFVPLSLGSGITLVEGIGDFDPERRFGLPPTDKEVATAEAEWYGRPDYARSVWGPDGVERDRARFARGLGVVGRNPLWFSGVMSRRAALMLRYNDDDTYGWPADTSLAPPISPEPAFRHDPTPPDRPADWSAAASELFGAEDLRLAAPDEASSPPIPVAPNADYVLRVRVDTRAGSGAVRVVREDDGATLRATPVFRKRRLREADPDRPRRDEAPGVIEMPFATGAATAVRVVAAADAGAARPLELEVRGAELFALGPTPYAGLRPARVAVSAVQSRLYRTWTMRALVLLGGLLLAAAGRRRELAIVLAVPLYYAVFQSALHTEYRYVLALHELAFLPAAVTVLAAARLAAGSVLATTKGDLLWRRASRPRAFDRDRRSPSASSSG